MYQPLHLYVIRNEECVFLSYLSSMTFKSEICGAHFYLYTKLEPQNVTDCFCICVLKQVAPLMSMKAGNVPRFSISGIILVSVLT